MFAAGFQYWPRLGSGAMKTLRWLMVQMLTLSCLAFSPSGAAAEAGEGKWEDLFNGKDLSGWVGVHDVKFEVVEGNLRLVKGMGWLRTEKPYRDFILEFEWRALEEESRQRRLPPRRGLEGDRGPKTGGK